MSPPVNRFVEYVVLSFGNQRSDSDGVVQVWDVCFFREKGTLNVAAMSEGVWPCVRGVVMCEGCGHE